jgi:hypothetical protein
MCCVGGHEKEAYKRRLPQPGHPGPQCWRAPHSAATPSQAGSETPSIMAKLLRKCLNPIL